MSIISKHILNNVKASPTLMIETKAREMRAAGLNVISLATGEPDFQTLEFIKQAAIDAINKGFTKYTPVGGAIEIKKAIVQKFKRENNIDYALDEVCVGSGAKQVIFNAFAATLDPGDEVIILAPYWVSYPDMVQISRGTPVFVSLDPKENFKLDIEKIAKAITPKTKWIMLNSPNNPCGSVYSREELQELANLLLKHPNIYVLSDDIYEHIIFDKKFYTLAGIEPKLKDRILTVNGVSKSYAMTGWRLGFGAGSKELIKAMTMMQSQSTSNPCSISQMAAAAALEGPQDFIKSSQHIYLRRRNTAQKILNDSKGLNCTVPEGAFYLFVDCSGLLNKKTSTGKVLNDSYDVANYFLEKANVAVVPGSAFGIDGFFRISFATSDENILEGCNRIKQACEEVN